MSPVRAVLLDWRGTLATTLTEHEWVEEAMRRLGRTPGPAEVAALAGRLAAAAGRLDAPGVDSDAVLHAATYRRVLRGLGLDDDLVNALYAVESDPACNRFADDVAPTLRALRAAGIGTAVVSDIHVDIRPALAAAGLGGLVDAVTLSFEEGTQKPDPVMWLRTLDRLGVPAAEALVVGDRAGPDGGAVEAGLVTLLLPPLRSTSDRRLHHVLALCGLGTPLF